MMHDIECPAPSAPFALRPFGARMDDLDVDFTAPRPYVITDVLERCASGTTAEVLWDLTAGQRIAALLNLASVGGIRKFDMEFACPQCGMDGEVVLESQELLQAATRADFGPVTVRNGMQTGLYRLPTGRDQAQWLGEDHEDEGSLLTRMIASLRVAGDADSSAIEAALDAADPLVRTVVTSQCPQCGHAAEREFDVVEHALRRLEAEQHRLLSGVHLLASRYHWSEGDISALPSWRRERYLDLLRGEN